MCSSFLCYCRFKSSNSMTCTKIYEFKMSTNLKKLPTSIQAVIRPLFLIEGENVNKNLAPRPIVWCCHLVNNCMTPEP